MVIILSVTGVKILEKDERISQLGLSLQNGGKSTLTTGTPIHWLNWNLGIRTQTFVIDLLNFFTQIYIIVTYISHQSPIWVVYKNVLNFVLVAMATKHGGWVAKHFNNNWDDQKHKQTGTKHDWCMKDAGQFWVKLYGRVAMTTVNNEMK